MTGSGISSVLASLLLLLPLLAVPGQAQIVDACVRAGDFYDQPVEDLARVELGPIAVTQAVLPTGQPVPLDVADCAGEKALDVVVPWSEATADPPARIHIAENLCRGSAPRLVQVVLRHGKYCILHGLDEKGTEVATAVADIGSDIQVLSLFSQSGIRTITIDGSEICILSICWGCAPAPDGCVQAGDVFEKPASDLPEVNLGAAVFTQARLRDGTPVPLDVVDCSGDESLDVAIPWTEDTASEFAALRMSPNLCGGNAPLAVLIILRHSNSCLMEAYTDGGTLVDTAVAADHGGLLTIFLSSPNGIRTILFKGSEICVVRVCWFCGDLPPTPSNTPVKDTPTRTATATTEEPTDTPTPAIDNCVEPAQLFDEPNEGLPEVNLGWVLLSQARLATGEPVPLQITDCSQDAKMDVFVPWSQAGAAELASILMSPNLCQGNAPGTVQVFLQHFASCTLFAHDDDGNLVDSAVAAPSSDPQMLELSSPNGIRTLFIDGAEICITRICWFCDPLETPTDTPVAPTVTPLPPTHTPAVPTDTPMVPTGTPEQPTERPTETPSVPTLPAPTATHTPTPTEIMPTDTPEPSQTVTETPTREATTTATPGIPTDTPAPTGTPEEPTPTREPTPTEPRVPTARYPCSDINGDGFVDEQDLFILMMDWHRPAQPVTPCP